LLKDFVVFFCLNCHDAARKHLFGKELNMPNLSPIPAAQYVRMSTDHQQYSTLSQTTANQGYADVNGFTVVRSYEDPGRSGLSLKGRPGLARLLHDVVSGEATFKAILVYDVSRWGRFQDSDEAAYYEFICKTAGIPIHYCAETFANDGTFPSTIMKALKRAMASEYSRELSVRVARAKRLATEKGFRVGGLPGYGLRRMLLSPDGKPKRLLEKGEYVDNARVVLVHGPANEVAVVREIYRLCVDGKKGAKAIARELNQGSIEHPGKQSSWRYEHVVEILTNPKYMGQAVLGRTICPLHTQVVTQPPDKWTVKNGAFAPIVEPETFAAAQKVRHDRTLYKSDEELLIGLRAFLSREGMLSQHMIDSSRDLPSVRAFVARFGSMTRVYELIGYDYSEHILAHPKMRKIMWKSRFRREKLRRRLLRDVCKLFRSEVKVIRKGPIDRPVLCFSDGLRISVLICPSTRTPLSYQRWRLPQLRAGQSQVSLLCLCNDSNDAFQEFYLVPSVGRLRYCVVKRDDKQLKLGTRVRKLSQLRIAAKLVRAKDTSVSNDSEITKSDAAVH
jgi:DNA invertase Pin-like site-specific DNA recombinase